MGPAPKKDFLQIIRPLALAAVAHTAYSTIFAIV